MKRMLVLGIGAVLMACAVVAEDIEDQPIVEEIKEKPAKKEKKPKAPKVKKQKMPKVKKAKIPKEKKEKAPKAEKPETSEVEEMTIAGVITKVGGGKVDGKKVALRYILTDSDGGKMTLPKPPKVKKGDEDAKPTKWSDHVDKTVTLVVKGRKVTKGDETRLMLEQIISIEKLAGVAEIDLFGDKGGDED